MRSCCLQSSVVICLTDFSLVSALLTNPPSVAVCPQVVAFCILTRISNCNWKERWARPGFFHPGWLQKSRFSVDHWEKILQRNHSLMTETRTLFFSLSLYPEHWVLTILMTHSLTSETNHPSTWCRGAILFSLECLVPCSWLACSTQTIFPCPLSRKQSCATARKCNEGLEERRSKLLAITAQVGEIEALLTITSLSVSFMLSHLPFWLQKPGK